jgi:predicted N-acetyltransferase YhbS
MNIQISLLKDHPDSIPLLAQIWFEVLGKIWLPEVPIQHIEQKFITHLNDNTLPLTLVAHDGNKPVGMCSLRENDGIRFDLTPWLASLVVHPFYQNHGIAKLLIDKTKQKATDLGFKKLYLFAFDQTIPFYYEKLGWYKIAEDKFKEHPLTVMEINL